MTHLLQYTRSSIGKKQIVAVTGLMLIGFLIMHLAGNLLIFLGPDAFNHYAQKLANLRPGLYGVEVLLSFIFIRFFFSRHLLLCIFSFNLAFRCQDLL